MINKLSPLEGKYNLKIVSKVFLSKNLLSVIGQDVSEISTVASLKESPCNYSYVMESSGTQMYFLGDI